MDISGLKNFIPTPVSSSSSLSLNLGQMISAQIVKSEGGQILLQYGGYLFKAKTKLALQPGEKIKLRVESVDNNLINLKIVSGKESQPAQMIAALLSPLQKPEPHLEMIARQLTKFNLPVSLDLLTDISKFIKKHKLSADISSLLVWLKSAGIVADSEQDIKALRALHKFFRGELDSELENELAARCFTLLNSAENQYAGGVNISGWALGRHHIYLVREGAKGEEWRSDHCQLAVKVESAALQELWFLIDHSNHQMTARIYCQAEHYKHILERETLTFKAALQAAGYQLGEVTVAVHSDPLTIFDLLPAKEIGNVNISI